MTSVSSTLGFTLSEKHVAKHRSTPSRSLRTHSGHRLRKAAVLAGVAVAATGLAVSTGLVAKATPLDGGAAAALSSAATPSNDLTQSELSDREERASRSSDDRRPTTDAVKARALSNASGGAHADRGPVRGRPEDPRQGADAAVRHVLLGVRLPGQHLEPGVRLERARRRPQLLGLRHPAGPSGSKMSSAGPNWADNPETQIRWGLGYIKGRYGSACARGPTSRVQAGTDPTWVGTQPDEEGPWRSPRSPWGTLSSASTRSAARALLLPADGGCHLVDGLVGAGVLRAPRRGTTLRDPLRQPGHRAVVQLAGRRTGVLRRRPLGGPAPHPRRAGHPQRPSGRRLHGWRDRAGHRCPASGPRPQPDAHRDHGSLRPRFHPAATASRGPFGGDLRAGRLPTTSTGTTRRRASRRWSTFSVCTPVRGGSTRTTYARWRASSWAAPATFGPA